MLTVYTSPVSLYCAKLRILMRYKGLDWREVAAPGGHGSEAYLRLVPTGTLPALDHDGVMIGDSEAIMEYLDEVFPAPPMLPGGAVARVRARELARFHDTRLEPAVRVLFAQVAPAARDAAVLASAAQAISARLSQLAALLASVPDADPGTLTLGDCGLPVSFAWIDALDALLGLGVAWPDAVRAYERHLHAIPAVRDELVAYRPAMTEWLETRSTA